MSRPRGRTGTEGDDMANAVYVKRVKDADGAACQDCGHPLPAQDGEQARVDQGG